MPYNVVEETNQEHEHVTIRSQRSEETVVRMMGQTLRKLKDVMSSHAQVTYLSEEAIALTRIRFNYMYSVWIDITLIF